MLTLLFTQAWALEITGANLDHQGGLTVESPTLGEAGAAYGGVGAVYAPESVTLAHALAGYTFHRRFRLDFGGSYAVWPDESVGLDELQLAGVVALLRPDTQPFAIGLRPGVRYKPSTLDDGATADGVEGGDVGGLGELLVGVRWSRLLFNLGGGVNINSFDLSDKVVSMRLSGGLGVQAADALLIGVESRMDGALMLVDGYLGMGEPDGLQATLGAGYVAPEQDFHVLLTIGYRYAGNASLPDADGDKVDDSLDQCKNEAEDRDGFLDSDGCLDPDNDQDGVADLNDGCRNDAEDMDGYADTDGCADPDDDQDGVMDARDTCPRERGLAELGGCPDQDNDRTPDPQDPCPTVPGPRGLGCPDRDTDGVPDNTDRCPDDPRDPREDVKRSDGCPHRVFVGSDRVVIDDRIFFAYNQAVIEDRSFSLLDEIATTLNNNPDLKRIEVGGHTDSDGDDAFNLELSLSRAEAVITALVERGVEKSRLEAVGYGETQPIDSNATDAGKANNRRVEFLIVEVANK